MNIKAGAKSALRGDNLNICPTCGLNRDAAVGNYQAGDPTAKYLLTGCKSCKQWFMGWLDAFIGY